MPNFEYLLREASGEFFFWAAHDDWWSADFAELAIEALRARPDAACAMGVVQYIGQAGEKQASCAPPYRLDHGDRFARVRSYFSTYPTDALVYGVFRRSALMNTVPFVRCSCPEKLIIMHSLLAGPIVDVDGITYYSQIVQKDPAALADTIGIPRWSDGAEITLFRAMVTLLGRHLSIAQMAAVLPVYVAKNNWHRFFARYALRSVGLLPKP